MDYNYSAYRRGNRGSPQQPHRWSKWLPWVYTGIQAALMTKCAASPAVQGGEG